MILKVSFCCEMLKLPVVPAHHLHAIGATVDQIVAEVRLDAYPQQWGQADQRWSMILIDVSEDFVIKRKDVFYLT